MHAVAICAFKGYRAFTSFRLKTILITDKANVVDILSLQSILRYPMNTKRFEVIE